MIDFESLKNHLAKEIERNKNEARYSAMLAGSFWEGKAAALEELFIWLKNKELSTCSDDVLMTPAFEGEIKGFAVTPDILKGMMKYELDKELAEKSGMDIKDVCQHESNGLMYTSYPPKLKCIKCGAFY